jgi:hypothetical protein
MTQSTSGAAVPEGMRIIQMTATCSMAEYDRCILTVWRQQPTKAAFETRHDALVAMASQHPGKCGYIELIEPESKPPSDETRKLAVETFKKLGKDVACVAFVIDGPELRSAFVRAILTTMTLFLPQMQPSKVFKRLPDMANWVRPRIGQDDGFNSRVIAAFGYLRSTSSTT